MNRSSLNAAILPALLLASSCNNSIYVDPLRIGEYQDTLSSETPELFIPVKGSDWTLKNIIADNPVSPIEHDKNIWVVRTPVRSYTLTQSDKGLTVKLDYSLMQNPEYIHIGIGNDWETQMISLKVMPTGRFEILNTEYVLSSWEGFEPYETEDIPYQWTFPASPEIRNFSFVSNVMVLAGYYSFGYLYGNNSELDRAVLDSHRKVPIPSAVTDPTGHFTDWSIAGDSAMLTMERNGAVFHHFPDLPAPIDIPANKEVVVKLKCTYNNCGFGCTIRARNPVTGDTVSIASRLNIEMPVSLSGYYE